MLVNCIPESIHLLPVARNASPKSFVYRECAKKKRFTLQENSQRKYIVLNYDDI